MTRPTVVVVVGTATAVGKTWVTCQLARLLIVAGESVAARKPAQSFSPGQLGHTDAEVLGAASGEEAHDVCPRHRWYPAPMAPPMAAAALGKAPIRLADLLAELSWPANAGFVLVETAGGICSPLADDGDSSDFTRACRPDHTLLVADAGLGTLNDCRLASRVLGELSLTVVLNRFDPHSDLHRRNLAWLRVNDGLEVVTEPDLALLGIT